MSTTRITDIGPKMSKRNIWTTLGWITERGKVTPLDCRRTGSIRVGPLETLNNQRVPLVVRDTDLVEECEGDAGRFDNVGQTARYRTSTIRDASDPHACDSL